MSANNSRAELLKKLRKLRVEAVTAAYDGSGDSGQIDDPDFGCSEVPRDLVMAVQDLFYDVLADHYGGWEINEGSFGEFAWDVQADRINLVYNGRIESVHTEEQNL
jgi:hypothetical protein